MKILQVIFFAVLLVFVFNFSSYSQQKDTLQVDSAYLNGPKPWKAALMSAVVPGLGQIYNKKYWKLPVIYAGIGSFVYLVTDFNNKYKYYRQAFAATKFGAGPVDFYNDPRYANYSREDRAMLFEKYKDLFRRYRDLNAILFVAFYVLNIIDASVDAHFSHFNIDNKLVQVEPILRYENLNFQQNNYFSLGLAVRF